MLMSQWYEPRMFTSSVVSYVSAAAWNRPAGICAVSPSPASKELYEVSGSAVTRKVIWST